MIVKCWISYRNFANSEEVNNLKWYKIEEVDEVIAREYNCLGMHFDACRELL